MADPILDEINLSTLPEINASAIEDNFFLGSVFQAHMRAKALVPFKGGAYSRNTFLYNPLNAGAYARGAGGFNMTKPQTLSGTIFDPRYYVCMIVEYLEDIMVLNEGDNAIFDLMEVDMANAYQTISAIMALDMQQNGQTTARSINMNGWVEAMNDGICPSYDGNIYTSYGTQLRNGVVRKALNGNVYWCGDSNGNAGALTYPVLNAAYTLCRRGGDEPDLGVGNKPVVTYIENKLQAQQRFDQSAASVRDPYYGQMGFKFKNATIMQDDYFPSAKGYPYSDATNAGLGSNLTGTFTSPNVAGLPNNFPQNKTLTVGEVFCFFNTGRWRFRVANNKEFGFSPTPFIRAADTTKVASQLKGAVNLECTAPWTNVQMYGING